MQTSKYIVAPDRSIRRAVIAKNSIFILALNLIKNVSNVLN